MILFWFGFKIKSHYVTQTGLEFSILLLLSSECICVPDFLRAFYSTGHNMLALETLLQLTLNLFITEYDWTSRG